MLHKKCRNAFHYEYGLIKPGVIGQVAACNTAEQEEVADGIALNFNTFVYLAHRNWRYVDAERENRSASCSDKARFRDERMASWSPRRRRA